jgi:saccharopine dehydrogenase-like NADP-dependent oxidoreductase
MRTLVLGGYGNFGARICRALAGNLGIELLVGGRDAGRATDFAARLGHGALGMALDHTDEQFAYALRDMGVQLLIHTAGPFQDQAYRVARAAAWAGAHYIDLADGRRFVCDFARALDHVFRGAERTAITGASTVPALSSAVIEHLCGGWRRIEAIDICVAPGQQVPRGEAAMAAVLAYCGEPIAVWDDGQWQLQRGWSRPQPVHVAHMKPRMGALCDIPDLELFPERFRVTRRVMYRAALELPFAQRVFSLLAGARAAGLVRRPQKLARVLVTAARALDFLGSATGGMSVEAEGIDVQGREVRRAWHIAADDGHGPEIPCMAAILLARKLAQGEALPVGAMPCMGLLSLSDFEPEFAHWRMRTEVVGDSASTFAARAAA